MNGAPEKTDRYLDSCLPERAVLSDLLFLLFKLHVVQPVIKSALL
jgi:hypothetical protein